jgi:hypothetical protein
MGWGTYSNSPTMYFGLPSQGNGNLGVLGIVQRSFRGEKSGLDDSFLKTLFIQHDFQPNDKLSIMARAVYRETGTADDSYLYITVDGHRLIRTGVASYSNRVEGELSGNYLLSQMHRLSAGVDFYQDNVESGARHSTLDLSTIYLVDGRDTVTNLYSSFLPRVFDIRNNFGSLAYGTT